jgi:hypothetical protein
VELLSSQNHLETVGLFQKFFSCSNIKNKNGRTLMYEFFLKKFCSGTFLLWNKHESQRRDPKEKCTFRLLQKKRKFIKI